MRLAVAARWPEKPPWGVDGVQRLVMAGLLGALLIGLALVPNAPTTYPYEVAHVASRPQGNTTLEIFQVTAAPLAYAKGDVHVLVDGMRVPVQWSYGDTVHAGELFQFTWPTHASWNHLRLTVHGATLFDGSRAEIPSKTL